MLDDLTKRKEQRSGPDIWVKLINWFALISGILIVAALWIADKAKPQAETFIDRCLGILLPENWDLGLVRYAFYLMIATSCICAIGILINSKRHKRKYDSYNIPLIFVGGLSAIGILIYLFRF